MVNVYHCITIYDFITIILNYCPALLSTTTPCGSILRGHYPVKGTLKPGVGPTGGLGLALNKTQLQSYRSQHFLSCGNGINLCSSTTLWVSTVVTQVYNPAAGNTHTARLYEFNTDIHHTRKHLEALTLKNLWPTSSFLPHCHPELLTLYSPLTSAKTELTHRHELATSCWAL